MDALDLERPTPSSLIRHISPPPPKRRKRSEISTTQKERSSDHLHVKEGRSNLDTKSDNILKNAKSKATDLNSHSQPPIAAVEAGLVQIQDHLSYFLSHFTRTIRQPESSEGPLLRLSDFAALYNRHQHPQSHHFVIHQHNHPRAGVHYDLRLQFSDTSSISFAIPKGLPGNPNSRSRGRLGVETRVHCLWNHLIESASSKSGSLLIWDTGSYDVLPRKIAVVEEPQTTDEDSDSSCGEGGIGLTKVDTRHENEKLIEAFQTRYIRLRLHGTRLPENYTITLRLPSNSDFGKTGSKSVRPAKRRHPSYRKRASNNIRNSEQNGTDSEPDAPTPEETAQVEEEEDLDTDDEATMSTRVNNAYPGSHNTVGSIHQRHWFLMLDPRSSGFIRSGRGAAAKWVRDGEKGFDVFHVKGREFERSVVTGRLAAEVESDEGVECFVGRKGWVGIEV